MVRPKICRRIRCNLANRYFKPQGIPLRELQEISLTLDELEAIRLVDMDELYQEAAARSMTISRQTLGRILKEAHKKIAKALIEGKALKIESLSSKMGEVGQI